MKKQIKFELFVAPLFITLAIMSIKYVGFFDIKSTLFTTISILQVPLSFIASKYVRKLIYSLVTGYIEYEN